MFISKGDIFKAQVSSYRFGFEVQRVLFILNLDWQVQILKDTIKQCQRPLNIYLDTQQLADGEEEAALQGCKCHYGSKCHGRLPKQGYLVNNLPSGDQVDD